VAVNKKIALLSLALILLIPRLFAASDANPVQVQAPAGHWTFDDGSGSLAVDSSGNGRTATLVNGISWGSGEIGGAVSANAANRQYVSIPPIDLSRTHSVTVSLWANRTYSTAGGHTLFEATSDYINSTSGFGLFPDDATCHGIQAALRGDIGLAANCYSPPSSGVWHHLAVVFDKSQTGGNQVLFYVDGVLQSATWSVYASTNTNNFGNDPLYLFSRGGTDEFDSGAIDDLRIYNAALTAAQIQQIYNSAQLVSLTVTPATLAIAADQQQQFTAIASYKDGSTRDLSSSVTWTLSAPAVATISGTGLATAHATGITTVRATSGSTSGSANVIINMHSLVSIAVTPTNPSIAAGQQQQFTATGTYSDGSHQNITNSVTWSSGATAIATINGTGLATSVAVGTTVIKAKCGSINGSTSLTVTPPTLVSITVTPANSTVAVGQQQQFTATGTYTDASKKDLTSTATWTSSATSFATISGGGLATAVAAGSTTIQATSGAIKGSTALTVTAPTLVSIAVTPANPSIAAGQQQQFTATGTYTDASKKDLTSTATWTSSATSFATISGTGLAAGVAAGSTTIQATSGAIKGSTTLTVTASALVSIAVTPANPSIAAGQQQQFTATGTYTDASKKDLTSTAAWTSSAPSVATITGGGLATSLAAGSTTIQATSGSISGSTTLTVTAPVLVSIAVTPSNASIAAGQQQQFTATGTYTDASKKDLTSTATWTSSAPSVATISSGLANSLAAGSTTIQATSGSITGSTTLTVTAPTLVSITVTPANPSIAAGQQQQFTAAGTYTDASKKDLTSTATWTSSAPSVATISSGLANSLAAGSTTIQATSGSITGSTTLTVTAPTLVSITVTPTNPSIAAGQQQQFTAAGTYTDASKKDLTSTATWTSSATSFATIAGGGLATAVAAGSTTIQATSGSITGSTTLTVTQLIRSVALAWTGSISSGISGYNAYRATVSGGPYTLVNSGLIANTSYIDQTVQSGVTYYYVTTAVDSLGDESAYSNEAVASVP
jgi:uncharacterized protein YjdB